MSRRETDYFMKKVALHNLGCKVNAYETEAMQEILVKNGYEIVPFEEKADIYIVNTCTVTNMADRKSRQMLHRARKQNPEALVVATGCYVQSEDAIDPAVDLVVGNNRKKDIVSILEDYEAAREDQGKRASYVPSMKENTQYEELSVSNPKDHTRAFVKVQDGCNQYCAYCIIPYVRGRSRSRDMESILTEVESLAGNGYREIVLTGIHLSSYGLDLGTDLLSLIRNVHQVDGIKRIRLGSLEPRIVTEDFAGALASLPKVCPHFHLSLQSGCDETLKRMNRHYTSAEYMEKCEILRKYFKDPALTTDVIVGFPGETDEEFAASYDFIDAVNFYETHVFKYSNRSGTKAADMKGQIPEKVKTKRSHQLIELSHKKQSAYEERLYGTTQEVLIEEEETVDGTALQVGHTKTYVKVGVKSEESLINQLVQVKIGDLGQIIH